MNRQINYTALLTSLICSTFIVGPEMAKAAATSEAAPAQLENITVTARKRNESSLTVPVAITAITSAALEKAAITNLDGIGKVGQVMVSHSDSGTGATFTIRGIGTPSSEVSLEQSVSANIDGVQVSRGNIINQGFFDMAQVEVLKGPQALYFGKNSSAGVISVRTVNPTDRFEGYARVGYEVVAREIYGEAAAGGPLTDTLKARIAIRASGMHGWMHNTALPHINDNPTYPAGLGSTGAVSGSNGGKEYMGRITLVYTPSDKFDATLKFQGGDYKDHGSTIQPICASPVTTPTVKGVVDPAADCTFDNRYTSSGVNPGLIVNWPGMNKAGTNFTDTWSMLGSLTMNAHLGDFTLTSVSGFTRLKNRQAIDFSYSSFGSLFVPFGESDTNFSEELRLSSNYSGRLNFMVGGYYEHTKRDQYTNSILLYSGFAPNGKVDSYEQVAKNTGQTLSAFQQLRWTIIDQLDLSGGVRYTHESKDVLVTNAYVNPVALAPLNLQPVGNFLIGHFTDDNWSPEATLSWKPIQDTMIYGAFKTGFKSGGFSNPALFQNVQNSTNTRFNSEKALGFEIGFKSMLANRSIRLEGDLYSYRYSNFQVSAFNQATFSYFIKNAAVVRTKGAEFSGQWRATDELTLNTTINYTHARYVSFPGAQCYTYQVCPAGNRDLAGAPLIRAPAWWLSGGFTYDRPIGSEFMFGLNGDVTYISGYYTTPDEVPIGYQKGYALINAGARVYSSHATGWEIAVIGLNLTNKFYMVGGTGKSQGSKYEYLEATPRPREVKLQATYRF